MIQFLKNLNLMKKLNFIFDDFPFYLFDCPYFFIYFTNTNKNCSKCTRTQLLYNFIRYLTHYIIIIYFVFFTLYKVSTMQL
jgi:hypothetical protein